MIAQKNHYDKILKRHNALEQDRLISDLVFFSALGVALLLPPIVDSIILRLKHIWLSFLLGSLSSILSYPILLIYRLFPTINLVEGEGRGLHILIFQPAFIVVVAILYMFSSLEITLLALSIIKGPDKIKKLYYRPWLSFGLMMILMVILIALIRLYFLYFE